MKMWLLIIKLNIDRGTIQEWVRLYLTRKSKEKLQKKLVEVKEIDVGKCQGFIKPNEKEKRIWDCLTSKYKYKWPCFHLLHVSEYKGRVETGTQCFLTWNSSPKGCQWDQNDHLWKDSESQVSVLEHLRIL